MSDEYGDDFNDIEDLDSAEEDSRPLVYPNAEAWVQGWLLPHYRRTPDKLKWRADWWALEEVQLIIESLWECWEQARYGGATGIIVYLRDYFYPMMDRLHSPDGPLWNVTGVGESEIPDMLPVVEAPEGMYRPEGET